MLTAEELEKMVKEGSGRKEQPPFVSAVGLYTVTLKKIRMKRDKGQKILVKGELIDVPGKVLSYSIDCRVDATPNANKHPVGSDVTVWMEASGKYEASNHADLFEFCRAFYASLGESIVVGKDATDEQKAAAIANINAVLGDPTTGEHDELTTRGCQLLLNVRLPKATDKEGKPKAKVPTEDGFTYKDWRPVQQTVEQMLARRAELDKAA